MTTLAQGSSGDAVVALQTGLIRLGFLASDADGLYGPRTSLAVRDLQRRLLLQPDGVVGPRTGAALAGALARQPPSPTSPYRRLRRQGQELEHQGLADDDHLPQLDRGLAASPFAGQPPAYARRLASPPPASELTPYPDRCGSFQPYPAHGVVPPILSGRQGRGGLEFLSEEVSQACLCIGGFSADQPLRVRWYGRRALEDNVQFWSATKFIAGLHVACQANRRSPGMPIGTALVMPRDGGAPESFSSLFQAMVDYAPRQSDGGSSNRIGYLLKQLLNQGEDDVQTWLRRLSGNPEALLLGWYGQWRSPHNPYLAGADLVAPGAGAHAAGAPMQPLVGHRLLPRSRNLLSAYDLVRMLTLLGWHPQLDPDRRLPGAHWISLASLVEGLGHDSARYLDGALEQLGLLDAVSEPVILSKLGYGAVTGDPAIDALTYAAFASFQDRRFHPARQRCFALALRVPTRQGDGLLADARMGTEVTEIVRRIFAEELG